MTNSADPDQLASFQISWLLKKPTDLDLHCFQRQGMSCSAREGLINFTYKLLLIDSCLKKTKKTQKKTTNVVWNSAPKELKLFLQQMYLFR